MKTRLLFILTILALGLNAQNEINPESSISDVTVYLNGAQVTRTANVSLKSGDNIITLSGLAQGVNPKSVNVAGNGNYMIKSVNHTQDYLGEGAKSAQVVVLEEELKDLDFSLSTRTSLEQVYREEKGLLLANKSMKGANQSLLAEDLKEMAAFFREHLEELEYKLLELKEEKQELQQQKYEIQLELNKVRAKFNRYSSKINVVINSNKTQNVPLEVSYVVYNASWFATYDVRTSEVDKPVQLIYKANISQSTGIDWSDVNLTLSTGNPMVTGTKPTLNPWYISEYSQVRAIDTYNSQRDRTNERYKSEAPAEVMEGDMSILSNYQLGSVSMVTESVESLITAEFNISIPFSVPTDGQSYDVEIQRNDLASSYSYYTAPTLDNDAYLLARLTKWSDLNLLPGDANVFYQGSFVGTSFLDPYATEDTLDVSLGKDKNIIVSREQVAEFCKTSSFGGNKKTSRAFKITVKNNKSTSVKINLEDQIPISQRNDITVTTEELSGGSLNEETGIVNWEMDLAPGVSKEVFLKFEVKYPKKMKLARL
ncbi:MAG: DUF4139 domain-containing protein [Flavobacteriales bacterium]